MKLEQLSLIFQASKTDKREKPLAVINLDQTIELD